MAFTQNRTFCKIYGRLWITSFVRQAGNPGVKLILDMPITERITINCCGTSSVNTYEEAFMSILPDSIVVQTTETTTNAPNGNFQLSIFPCVYQLKSFGDTTPT